MEQSIGDKLVLRGFLYGDAPGLARNGNNAEIARNQRDSYPYPYTLEYARNWIQYVKSHYSDCRFVIAQDQEAIGEIGFVIQSDVHCQSAEVAYWLGEDYWGQGIATRALEYVTQYAFKEKGLKRLYADIIEYNTGSQRVLQKCGYQLDGIMRKNVYKDKKFYDQLVFSRLSDDKLPPVH